MSILSLLLAAETAANPIQYAYEQLISTGVAGAVAVLFLVLWMRAQRKWDHRENELVAKIESKNQELAAKQEQAIAKEIAFRDTYTVWAEKQSETYRDLTRVVLDALNANSRSHSENSEVLRQVLEVLHTNERALDNFLKRSGV